MAFPVGDEWTARPGAAAHCGKGCEPDPVAHDHPAEAANRAEDAARRAVEGRGVPDRDTPPPH